MRLPASRQQNAQIFSQIPDIVTHHENALARSPVCYWPNHRRHPEVLAVFGEPRRMGHKRLRPSFETPRKRAAPQDDG
jgi:hypothetical protein